MMPKVSNALRSAKLPPEHHKKLRRLASDYDMGMSEILVEAIDIWEMHRAGKPIPPPKAPLDDASEEEVKHLAAYLHVLRHAKEPEYVVDVVEVWARNQTKRRP